MLEKIKEKRTAELTAEDFKTLKNFGIMNGCGGCNRGFLQKFFLKILSPMFFEASCDLHDFGYWKGGDEARRAECDRKFYENIIWDINRRYYPGIWYYYQKTEGKIEAISFFEYFFKKNFYKILAKIFYIAVRLGGWRYFNFT